MVIKRANLSSVPLDQLAGGVQALGEVAMLAIEAIQRRRKVTVSEQSDYVLAAHAHELARRVLAHLPKQLALPRERSAKGGRTHNARG